MIPDLHPAQAASGAGAAGTPPARALSPAQQRLWYLHQILPDPGVLNIGVQVRVHGTLDTTHLRSVLQQRVELHAPLCEAFHRHAPALTPATLALIPWETADVSREPEDVRDRLAERAVLTWLQKPFDLSRPPLLRAGAVRVRGDTTVLFLAAHPLISDAVSLLQLLREWLEAPADAGGSAAFEVWRSRQVDAAGRVQRGQVSAAAAALPNPLPILEIPADFPRPSIKSYAGGVQRLSVPAQVAEVWKRGAAETIDEGGFLYAAWGLLLHKTGQIPAMVLGYGISGRDGDAALRAHGRFENTLPVVLEFPPEQTLVTYLRDVAHRLAAGAEQPDPIEAIIELLDPARDLSRPPLYQATFRWLAPELFAPIAGVDAGPPRLLRAGCQTDLDLVCHAGGESLELELAYSADLFSPATAQRFLERLVVVANTLAREPGAAVQEVNVLTSAEQRQLQEWNQTARQFPKGTLHGLFEQSAQRTPNAVAVDDGRAQLTYVELDQMANRLAAYLRELGAGAEVPVGIYAHRSVEMIAGLLAILKAGSAYVPLDPSYPRDRLDHVAENSGMHMVLCSASLAASLPGSGLKAVVIDDPEAIWRGYPARRPESAVEEHHLAYILYTSGSTGKPKGVEIPHQAATNLAHCMLEAPGLGAMDRVLALTTLAFDISVLEIFVTLAAGARIELVDRETALDPKALLRRIEDSSVTLMQATPATWQMLLDIGWQGRPGLRAIVGGEAVSQDLAAALLDRCDEVWDQYGPTEVTVYATVWRMEPFERIVIGRPIRNTTAYVVDAQLRQTPIGVPGELCLGGLQLARGYRGLPELTGEKFVPNPLAPGQRMYRTGDLARWLPNGTIEFLGRLDHQIKIRGFRVELGEIESVLLEQPGVAKAVVVAREDGGRKQLVGYVIPEPGCSLDPDTLRSGLSRKLPDYMVPAHYMLLEAFPLTPNGKVDRKALPKPEVSASAEATPPRNECESALVEIWQQELGVARVGIHDDFFQLGGDSLLAVRVAVRIEQRLGKPVMLATLFQAPTVAQLAQVLQEAPAATYSCVVPLQTQGARPPLFLVHGMGGNVVGFHTLTRHFAGRVPLYGVQALGLDGKSTPLSDVVAMARAYLAEIRQVQPRGPYFLGGLSLGGIIALEMAHQLHEAGEEVGGLVMLDAYAYGVERLGSRGQRAWRRLRSNWKRVRLHARNMFRAGLSGQAEYLRNKLHTLRRRAEWKLRTNQYQNFLPAALPENYNRVAHSAWTAMKQYTPRPASVPLLVVRAKDEPFLRDGDPTLGWGRVVQPAPRISEVPGDHLTLLLEPNAEFVARGILQFLEEQRGA